MAAPMYTAAARATGSNAQFKRVGFVPKTGRVLWWGTPYALEQRARKRLVGEFTEQQLQTRLQPWAHDNGLELRVTQMGAAPTAATPVHPAPVAPDHRAFLKAWMGRHLNDHRLLDYVEVRPIPFAGIRAGKPHQRTDCTGSIIAAYFTAGLPDPSGCHYNGQGNTASIRAHMPHRPLAALRVGDVIIYGRDNDYPRQHGVMVLEPHPTDPIVWSFGQPSGPFAMRHSVENGAHDGYFTTHGYNL